MSYQYAGVRPKRSPVPVIALVVGVVALLIGAAALAFAAEYKPSIENVLANPGGDFLSPEGYDAVRGLGFVALAIGGFGVLGGIIGLATRQTVLVQQPQPGHYGVQPQQWAPVRPSPTAAPAPYTGRPAIAPPPYPRPAVSAPPPNASQRVG